MTPFISRSLLSMLALCMLVPVASAQTLVNQARSISVTGQGEASGKPDLAEIDAGVQTFANTVIDASRQNQAVLERILDALQEQDIASEDIQTSNYSIWAEQDYSRNGEPGKERITGFRVSNIVHIKVRDISKVGEVLAAVTDAGANSVNGIRFTVKDTDQLEKRAREAAMADARARAESLASLAGVGLGEVISLSMSSAPDHPRPYAASRVMEMADAGAPVPGIAPGQQSVTVTIHASFAIR
ncbi:MAG TPA: SIMPL domain-containing protein [Woeseiaceae bacterium]|nr:SIMPL domain-containing protein [Woeseiaceae bacterium]